MLKGKDVISSIQKQIIKIFSQLPDHEQFYLTGGTALAEFYLGHRLSYDLDFFTKEEGLILPFSYEMEKEYSQNGFQVLINRRFATFAEFNFAKDEEKVRVDIALDSPFRFDQPVSSEYGILINNYKDLIIDKVLTYYGRFEPRDAIDLYFILQRENLDDLLRLSGEKDKGFDLYWFAVALKKADEFPDELERWPVNMLLPFEVERLKKLFKEITNQVLNRICKKDEDKENYD